MGIKRKAKESHPPFEGEARKKPKAKANADSKFLFAPRPDWHAAILPTPEPRDVKALPPQRTIDELRQYATSLLEAENAAYSANNASASSSQKFLSTIMSNGTLEDRVSALTLLVQESPLHTTKAFENLLNLSKKKSRNQALMALAALKDLLGQGVVLPGDRKLRAFGKQPILLQIFQGKTANWRQGEPLPPGLEKLHLIVWAYEDWLKRTYFEVLQVLENWLGDEVEYSRSRAVTYVWELLRDKPEQEENLLRLLVNKLGDTDRKIASRASHLLLQLQLTHPAMKLIIANSIEADCLYRPGQSIHAKYYAIITLNQTILGQKEQEVASKLLEIYFSLFVQLLKSNGTENEPAKPKAPARVQGGGGKAGKLAAKKRKAQEKSDESGAQLREKMIAQVLTGVNRAFPFADMNDAKFEEQLDTIFRVTHSANFNTAVQALMLIQQISSTKHYGAERFYKTLYESLLDPRLYSSSKQIMYLNLLYKSLKTDLNAKRVQAFVKRLLQIITVHDPPFVCGVLYLVSELEKVFPSVRTMMSEAEVDDDDEEEHFADVIEDDEGNQTMPTTQPRAIDQHRYDPRKRDPEHARADRSCLWEILPLLQHFHPSVSLFAATLLANKTMPPKPDPTQHTLNHFLDRFVYRSAKSKPSVAMHGSSIMQPLAGSSAADLLLKPGKESGAKADVNSEAFWQKKIEDVAADEVFFHAYFSQAGGKKKRKTAEKTAAKGRDEDDSEGSEDDGEDEIWKAITASKPDVEGDDEDDDLSLGDLESAYSDSEDGSEAGIDLGGEEGDGIEDGGLLLDDEQGSDADDLDAAPDLESDDDGVFDDDDEVPEDFDLPVEKEEPEEKELSKSQKKRKERKKFKQLPTFASAEDYAKLLGADEEEEDY
ncbi:CBF/Mak21 family-domain-containing protein [Neohortaea acidophila]|uniref:CBF/Mak21 family-domain-containing protein n=1 Tax=Neohortaea acidophila TaxID=245834 RepID=A0A6A6PXR8_9PEZI|nr:CBF/Mak21 family-domain-containing protein [Neohortaea acidophila]KAF2484293.1 CBF/Mak21 family-domain-containing protein [Neohortaea acidophila]